jgi:hypothetical protein
MSIPKFSMEELNKLHEQYQDNQYTKLPEEKMFIYTKILELLLIVIKNKLDINKCKKEYEDNYVKTGKFLNGHHPIGCIIPNDAFPDLNVVDHYILVRDDVQIIPHYILISWCRKGLSFSINPEAFEFDYKILNEQRKVYLSKKYTDRQSGIDKIVPLLIEDVNLLDLDECFKKYKHHYEINGTFGANITSNVRTFERLSIKRLREAFEYKYKPKDGRKVKLCTYKEKESQNARVEILPETFLE